MKFDTLRTFYILINNNSSHGELFGGVSSILNRLLYFAASDKKAHPEAEYDINRRYVTDMVVCAVTIAPCYEVDLPDMDIFKYDSNDPDDTDFREVELFSTSGEEYESGLYLGSAVFYEDGEPVKVNLSQSGICVRFVAGVLGQ